MNLNGERWATVGEGAPDRSMASLHIMGILKSTRDYFIHGLVILCMKTKSLISASGAIKCDLTFD